MPIRNHTRISSVWSAGDVYDLALEFPNLEREMIEGHKVTECHVYLKGVCKNCLKRTGK